LIPFGDTRPLDAQQLANHVQVSPAYVETLGIALVRGRPLTEADRGRQVALVSERTARAIWPGQDPIGLRFSRSERDQTWEVVDVVQDARIHGLERDAKLVAYVPYWGGARREASIVVRARLEAQALAGTVRAAVARLDAELPLQELRTMRSVVSGTLAALLFEVTPYDPLVLVGSGILVVGLSAVACLVPAARASRTEPVLVLRGP
jgi:hypothetical protein